jgi:hypothetical protein
MAWWDGPDPYRYERIGTHYTGRPVYVASLNGVELGVIEPVRASTDTKIKGTRLRRPGRGRDEFVAANRRVSSRLRRRDVADDLKYEPMTPAEIARARARYTKES